MNKTDIAKNDSSVLRVAHFIGRMQMLTHAHFAHIMTGLENYDALVVILGSSFHARNPDNPFTFEERKAMILAAVPDNLAHKLVFVGVRDYHDDAVWKEVVLRKSDKAISEWKESETNAGRIHSELPVEKFLLSYVKDASGYYQKAFKDCWTVVHNDIGFVNQVDGLLNATALREVFFSKTERKVVYPLLKTKMPYYAVEYLKGWEALNKEAFKRICEEMKYKRKYNKGQKYPLKATTGDAVFICNDTHVLIGIRGKLVGYGLYCIPGGHNNPDEDHVDSALRELVEEMKLKFSHSFLRELVTESFWVDRPKRSWLCRIITCVSVLRYQGILPHVEAGDDAKGYVWMTREDILANEDKFHDDHFMILCKVLGITPKD